LVCSNIKNLRIIQKSKKYPQKQKIIFEDKLYTLLTYFRTKYWICLKI
jgi:hypothetical protein